MRDTSTWPWWLSIERRPMIWLTKCLWKLLIWEALLAANRKQTCTRARLFILTTHLYYSLREFCRRAHIWFCLHPDLALALSTTQHQPPSPPVISAARNPPPLWKEIASAAPRFSVGIIVRVLALGPSPTMSMEGDRESRSSARL
jgi:hypothetical protein